MKYSSPVFPRCNLPPRHQATAVRPQRFSLIDNALSSPYQRTLKTEGIAHLKEMPNDSWDSLASFAELLHLSICVHEMKIYLLQREEKDSMSGSLT